MDALCRLEEDKLELPTNERISSQIIQSSPTKQVSDLKQRRRFERKLIEERTKIGCSELKPFELKIQIKQRTRRRILKMSNLLSIKQINLLNILLIASLLISSELLSYVHCEQLSDISAEVSKINSKLRDVPATYDPLKGKLIEKIIRQCERMKIVDEFNLLNNLFAASKFGWKQTGSLDAF